MLTVATVYELPDPGVCITLSTVTSSWFSVLTSSVNTIFCGLLPVPVAVWTANEFGWIWSGVISFNVAAAKCTTTISLPFKSPDAAPVNVNCLVLLSYERVLAGWNTLSTKTRRLLTFATEFTKVTYVLVAWPVNASTTFWVYAPATYSLFTPSYTKNALGVGGVELTSIKVVVEVVDGPGVWYVQFASLVKLVVNAVSITNVMLFVNPWTIFVWLSAIISVPATIPNEAHVPLDNVTVVPTVVNVADVVVGTI